MIIQPHVKHAFGGFHLFFTLFGGANGVVHNLLLQLFTLYMCSSKVEVSETFFLISWLLTMIIQAI